MRDDFLPLPRIFQRLIFRIFLLKKFISVAAFRDKLELLLLNILIIYD